VLIELLVKVAEAFVAKFGHGCSHLFKGIRSSHRVELAMLITVRRGAGSAKHMGTACSSKRKICAKL
jgi:hypothetical protein